MGLLNRFKELGGFVFALGCIVMWISFFGLDLIYSWVPSQIKAGITYLIPSQIITFFSYHFSHFFSNPVYSWSMGAKASILGFLLFFAAWIISKIRSKHGYRYWDRKALGIAKKMGAIFVLAIIFWLVSVMLLNTNAALAILNNSWPKEWLTGFLFTLILMGLYMHRIRAEKVGRKSLPSKIKSVFRGIFSFILSIAIIVGVGFVVWTVWVHPWLSHTGVTSWEYMPGNYYKEANKYVGYKYGNVPNRNRPDLKNFLLKIDTFPPYDWEKFTCSEASARLEWLLEGGGFDASIATSEMGPNKMGHAWVIVTLSEVNNVKVEATYFTKNHYNPPGIVQGQHVLIGAAVNYENPSEIYKNPEEAMKGAVIIPKSGWDWWNVPPYSQTIPFSEWG